MYDINLKIKEKVTFVKTLMDYEMREFLLKAYELAFNETFGENWLDDYLKLDKQKKIKIAKYDNKETCTWIEGLKHADFAATIKILEFDNEYRIAFCKYWGCDKNDNEKNIRLLATQLHQFRNDCSHINAFTNYAILTPDTIMANMCAMVNQCVGLCDDKGRLYSDIFQEKYKSYLLMSKTFLISDLLNEMGNKVTNSEFVKLCRKNKIEVSLDERSIVTDDIQKVISIVEEDEVTYNPPKKKLLLAGVVSLALVIGVTILISVTKCSSNSDNIENVVVETNEPNNDKDKSKEYKVSISGYMATETGVIVEIGVLNESATSITTEMGINIYVNVVQKDGLKHKKGYCLKIDKEIEVGKIMTIKYPLDWNQLGVDEESFESIELEDCEIIKIK